MTDEEIGDYIRRYVHKAVKEERDALLLSMVTMLKGQMSKQARQSSEQDAYFESAYTAYKEGVPHSYKRDYKVHPNLIEIAEYGDSDGTRNLSNTPVTPASQYS